MRTVQMTLDDDLIEVVDKVAKDFGTSRSAFTRKALRNAIGTLNLEKLERRHRMGYMNRPVKKGEFNIWEKEQSWGDK